MIADSLTRHLTWEQWGLILVPLYILLVLWMQWCMRKVKGGR